MRNIVACGVAPLIVRSANPTADLYAKDAPIYQDARTIPWGGIYGLPAHGGNGGFRCHWCIQRDARNATTKATLPRHHNLSNATTIRTARWLTGPNTMGACSGVTCSSPSTTQAGTWQYQAAQQARTPASGASRHSICG